VEGILKLTEGVSKIRINQSQLRLQQGGKKTIQLALKHADIWESSYLSPEAFAAVDSKFEEISKEYNVTKKIVKSIELDVIIAHSDSELE
jgi:alkanesulfonate monooxygenase SsuD/methylene tetrahydromethanopterin reductase-like flavin-dependent oxidoreductase (luciferase family)